MCFIGRRNFTNEGSSVAAHVGHSGCCFASRTGGVSLLLIFLPQVQVKVKVILGALEVHEPVNLLAGLLLGERGDVSDLHALLLA